MKLIITPAAQLDIEHIGDFVARTDPVAAEAFIDEVSEACERLTRFPRRFPLARPYGRNDIRRCLCGRCLIFYRVEPDTVRVIHVFHAASDYGPLLDFL